MFNIDTRIHIKLLIVTFNGRCYCHIWYHVMYLLKKSQFTMLHTFNGYNNVHIGNYPWSTDYYQYSENISSKFWDKFWTGCSSTHFRYNCVIEDLNLEKMFPYTYSTKETFLQYFRIVRKPSLQNCLKNLDEVFSRLAGHGHMTFSQQSPVRKEFE